MINTLEIINDCSSQSLSLIMLIIKRGLNIIQIFGPILLIISLSIHFFNLMRNPDNKKLIPKIRNSALAAIILFFIPLLVDVVLSNISNSNSISACWNERVESNYKTPSYYDTSNGNKQSVYQDPNDYQKGSPKPSPSPTTNTSNSSSSSNNDLDTVTPSTTLDTTPGQISGDVQIHFINPNARVDAIYIKAGNQSMFIDGGFKNDSKAEIAYLEKIGVNKIDYYLGSHSHKDHVEAAPQIISKFGITKAIVGRETCNGSGSTQATWYAIKGFANDQRIDLSNVSLNVLKPGDVFYLGGLKFTCIGPITVNNSLDKQAVAQNSNSLVIRLDYGTTSFLLTGDNSSDGTMNAINNNYPNMLNVDVLKNAHHNSCIGESSYQKINAEYVVFTTRKDYLPDNSCINRIKKYGAKYYYIVADGYSGNVIFTSNGSQIGVQDHA